ncbi:MAG: ATP-binding cassette domain-containing protein [Spirochaetota bacterium]|nr:ATP-binding cassette domain-containing protein [Spirochaetota bacterium]
MSLSKRILIFGNSGSGKSTLAKTLSETYQLPVLDLDTVSWAKDQPTERLTHKESTRLISAFIDQNADWIIEGCYGSLISFVTEYCDEMIFLNPGTEQCLKNNLSRPWEPHKYPSIEAQNSNLAMLQNWVRQYDARDDEYSLSSHRKVFDEYQGKKVEYSQLSDVP